MYKELEKYKTGKKIPTVYDVGNSGQTVTMDRDEYIFNLGDLVNDFINHKNKPFWKRKYYHSHLTEIYTDMLNKI